MCVRAWTEESPLDAWGHRHNDASPYDREAGGSGGDETAKQSSKFWGPNKPTGAGGLSSWPGQRRAFSLEPPEGKLSPADAVEVPDPRSRCADTRVRHRGRVGADPLQQH